jgi:hypothetical protein
LFVPVAHCLLTSSASTAASTTGLPLHTSLCNSNPAFSCVIPTRKYLRFALIRPHGPTSRFDSLRSHRFHTRSRCPYPPIGASSRLIHYARMPTPLLGSLTALVHSLRWFGLPRAPPLPRALPLPVPAHRPTTPARPPRFLGPWLPWYTRCTGLGSCALLRFHARSRCPYPPIGASAGSTD